MIRKDGYNYTSGHLSRNSRLSTGSVRKRQEQCSARFWRRIWVPLLLGGFLAACDTGGAGGVQTGGAGTTKPKAWYVSTFAGGSVDNTDGIGKKAGFGTPYGIVQIGNTFYVTDERMHSIRTIDTTTAEVETMVPARAGGDSHKDGPAASARFNKPRGAAAGPDGKLYVADFGNNRIRVIDLGDPDYTVSTIAGKSEKGTADGNGLKADGTAGPARFNGPSGLAVKGDKLYVADSLNYRIRQIDLKDDKYPVKTIAGSGGTGARADGKGLLDDGKVGPARFYNPSGLAVIGDTLYIADYGYRRIRTVNLKDTNYNVSTISPLIFGPAALVAIGDTLYFTEKEHHRIWAMDIATTRVRTIAGTGKKGSKDGIGLLAEFNLPLHITGSGSTLYVTTTGGLIRKLVYR